MKKGDLVWNYSIEVPGVVTKVWHERGLDWMRMLCFDDGTLELANDLEVVPLPVSYTHLTLPTIYSV